VLVERAIDELQLELAVVAVIGFDEILRVG
jgi:hypothetical protein